MGSNCSGSTPVVDVRPDGVIQEIKDSRKASETTVKAPRQARYWSIMFELPHMPSLPGAGINSQGLEILL